MVCSDEKDDIEAESSCSVQSFSTFQSMNLKANLLKGVFLTGFKKPSQIQRKAIMAIVDGSDVIAQAQSGCGKTATFSIGVLQRISTDVKYVQAIVLAPTRELASQIHKVFLSLSGFLGAKCLSCFGGQDRPGAITKQLQSGVHVVVGTPGRVLALLRSGAVKTHFLKMLVVDEVDEMLNRGLKEQLMKIYTRLPGSKKVEEDEEGQEERTSCNTTKPVSDLQCVIVSATLPKNCWDVISRLMRNPIKILVPRDELSLSGIYQCYIDVDEERWKFEAVTDIFNSVSVPQTVVFVSTRKKVEWLSGRLAKEGFAVSSAHGEMDQSERDNVLTKFRAGEGRILISTDVWARGIDVYTVALVINFDLPASMANYLHRIGRSGRFGRRGIAISLIAGVQDREHLKKIADHYKIAIQPAPNPLHALTEKLQDDVVSKVKVEPRETIQHQALSKRSRKRLQKRLAKARYEARLAEVDDQAKKPRLS